jgi:succinyl-CoA synthetase beta subunit
MSSNEARSIAEDLACPVVVKGQAWVTGRAELGAIRFANTPQEAEEAATAILGLHIDGFQIDTVLVEEKLDVEKEFYAGLIIDDRTQAPMMIFSSQGGSGIEEIARKYPESITRSTIDIRVGVSQLYEVARSYDARAAEINPIVLTKGGLLYAADCRITVDDNAVYRHPELGIEVAREFDRPASSLETIAWEVEKDDYRGTFYFIQLEHDFKRGDGVIGFHGAGGGGSMMSMDAVLNRGYRLADFVDTSGNPPASKVYRAARIVLAQEGIDGYFASGSGVASQEQFHSARGLVKAFMEVPLNVPAVIRLGGNAEDRAIEILERARDEIPAPVEGYGKDDTPEFCAERLDHLIQTFEPGTEKPSGWNRTEPELPYSFETVTGGEVVLDHAACQECTSKICIETCVPGILELQEEVPILNITLEEARKGGCSECLACEIECAFEGNRGGYVSLPIPGLD